MLIQPDSTTRGPTAELIAVQSLADSYGVRVIHEPPTSNLQHLVPNRHPRRLESRVNPCAPSTSLFLIVTQPGVSFRAFPLAQRTLDVRQPRNISTAGFVHRGRKNRGGFPPMSPRMNQTMKMIGRRLQVAAVFCLFVTAMATVARAGSEKYLHVRVDDAENGESVNVNLPLSIAEKVLPTVNKGNLHAGCVHISNADMDGVDIKAILDAIRSAPDNEFVTVKQKDQDVRVAKSNGNLIVHVRSTEGEKENVDITVPLKIVDALFTNTKDGELDLVAAIHALSDAGDALLITVQDASQH